MKTKVHLRVGYDKKRRKPTVTANVNPSRSPLLNGRGEPLPTVAFAIELDLPDAMFAQAERVIATLTVPESAASIAADVKLVEARDA